jgi:hypothetical protein
VVRDIYRITRGCCVRLAATPTSRYVGYRRRFDRGGDLSLCAQPRTIVESRNRTVSAVGFATSASLIDNPIIRRHAVMTFDYRSANQTPVYKQRDRSESHPNDQFS